MYCKLRLCPYICLVAAFLVYATCACMVLHGWRKRQKGERLEGLLHNYAAQQPKKLYAAQYSTAQQPKKLYAAHHSTAQRGNQKSYMQHSTAQQPKKVICSAAQQPRNVKRYLQKCEWPRKKNLRWWIWVNVLLINLDKTGWRSFFLANICFSLQLITDNTGVGVGVDNRQTNCELPAVFSISRYEQRSLYLTPPWDPILSIPST